MALFPFLCKLTTVIILSNTGCLSAQPGRGMGSKKIRIIGGQDATPGSWPWQVSLNDDFGFFCGGSLITSEWVLTAAHCLTDYVANLTIHLGQLSLSGPNPNEESRDASDVIIHPSYDPVSYNNDIALVKLSAPVNLSADIFPVCLASENSTFHTRTSSWITGWGVTADGNISNILQEVNLPVVGNNECKCIFPGLTENMMCAGLDEGGKDACQGDSGSALVTRHTDGVTWVQGGIVSFGYGCALPMIPGVYARVSRYRGWISSITRSSRPCFRTFNSPGVDSDSDYTCWSPATTTTTRSPTPTKDGDSVFDGGENLVHFSRFAHFMSLCGLLVSLYVLVGDVNV